MLSMPIKISKKERGQIKIYLAATAPPESKRKEGMFPIKNRLLSYYLIKCGVLEHNKIFETIKRRAKNED